MSCYYCVDPVVGRLEGYISGGWLVSVDVAYCVYTVWQSG